MKPFTLPLSDSQANLETVGGKGMSLAKMINAGFPVPDGFHVTTEAYRQFVAANDLQTKILAALKDADASLPASLETASSSISRHFTDSIISEDIGNAIKNTYLTLDPSHLTPVAVRSSATAEDLPDASFAGQQATFLNIRGEDALLDAVKKCWASLWTARAISYRIKNKIDQNAVALAVVVQEMVNAEAAGILFTANPMNGHRDEMVINAAWGLGEAIVGGLVSPDTIVADKATGKIKSIEVAEKTVITVLAEKGTEEKKLEGVRTRSKVMKEADVVELVNIARRIESFYGSPQDIEWCRAVSPSPSGRGARGEGVFYIVQSRPITALPETPIEWTPPNPKGIYMRTGVVDLMPSPLSPLYITWAIPTLRAQMKPLGARLGMGLPVLQEDYYTSINSYAYMNAAFPAKAWWWIITGMLPAYPRLLRTLVPLWRDGLHPEYQAAVAKYQAKAPEKMSAGELWQDAQEILTAAMYHACGLLFATMGASAGSEGLLTQVYNKMAKQEGDPEANVLLMGWDNIPVRSEKSLFDIAVWIREDEELTNYILDTSSHDLVGNLEKPDSVPVPLFPEFASRFKTHLEKFGHLVFQLDFAEPLPLDHPEMLLETVKMYLHGQGVNPHERQHASEEKRIQTTEMMRNRLKGFKRWAFIKALNWGQSMAEVREDALSEIGLGYPILRAMLRELGSRFVEAGVIQSADDIFWLEKDEVDACVQNLERGVELKNLSVLVEQRKAFNKKVGQETPPPMMPMKKKYMGIDTAVWLAESENNRTGNVLKGVPTSAGKVTAPARVLRGPEDFDKMRHGDVLVAGTTTPAWTPLFAMASAVVTDIGGPLSHGSIVAREYGIPAVMGTGVATKRIQSGQVITVDGTKGEVILEGTEESQLIVPPPTKWKLPKGAYAVMRNNIVELMADPLSPLFETLGLSAINTSLPRLMNESFGMRGIMPPELIIVVNHYTYNNGSVSAKGMARLTFSMGKIARMMFTGAVERWTERGRPHYYQTVENWQAKNWRAFSSVELVNSARQLTESAIDAYGALVSGVIPAAWITEAVFTNVYNRLIKRRDDPSAPTYLLGYDSLPIRADKSLYSLAEWARQNPALTQYLERTPTSQLVDLCEGGTVPGDVPSMVWDEWCSRFHGHLREFGHMLYDLDFAHPVPADDPAPVLDALKLYLSGKGTNPYTRQRESAERREQAATMMKLRLRGLRLKWFNKYLASAQKYAPLREDGLAEIGLAYPLIRQLLCELGNRFVQHKVIPTVDEIFWLTQDEVMSTATRLDAEQSVESLAEKIPQRKAEHRAALSVRPPMMLPQMKIFGFDLMSLRDKRGRRNRGDTIKGVATSPGVASGVARILHGPEDFNHMKPGDVLVAPITTPAWTPLFAMASAVVTDIGGPLSHGSIVAREYGIPAVLGTGVATKRIQSGQVITVDGTKGEVILETSKESQTEQPASPIEWKRPHPKAMYARASLAEHLPNAVSPLFGTLGLHAVNKATAELGDFLQIDAVESEYQYRSINGYVYMGILLTAKLTWAMIKVSFTSLGYMFGGGTKRWHEARKALASVISKWDEKKSATLPPSEILEGARELMYAAGKLYTVIQSGTLPTATSSEIIFTRLYKMVSRKDEPKAETLLFGLETVPLRAEKSQFDLGMWIRERPALRNFTLHASRSTGELAAALQADSTPEAIPAADWSEFKSRFDKHLDEFGRTSYEFDFMNPTPAETPELILDAVKMYVEGKGSDPHARQREVIEKREETMRKIRSRFKLIPNRWFNKAFQWAMDSGPAREDSLADMGMGHTTIRRLLGELGKRFVANGALESAEDIYWLVEDEVDELASLLERNEKLPDYSSKAFERKAEWRQQMKLVPPPMLPEKSRWAKLVPGNKTDQTGNVLIGVGASTGRVTAPACVLFAPEDFSKMKPGNVLVAVTTTPAWTPLFTMASAVVTDIGGPLSHSSIVAREYGIPAVLATGIGTRRITDGQIITVDGSAGTVELK